MMVLPGYPGTKRRNIGSLLMERSGKSVTTVKGMLTELAYFKEKVSRRLEALTNSGIKDADITEIDDCMTSLSSVDTDQ